VEAPSRSLLLRPAPSFPSADDATRTGIAAWAICTDPSRNGRLIIVSMTVQVTGSFHCQSPVFHASGRTALHEYGYPPSFTIKSELGGHVSPRSRRHVQAVATTSDSSIQEGAKRNEQPRAYA